jgi:hypothetical protein
MFIKVKWNHDFATEPVLLYSELDNGRWEVRKVEVFSDGHCEFASSEEASAAARLGLMPVPSLDEIAENPEFEPVEISREEFEVVWINRRNNG